VVVRVHLADAQGGVIIVQQALGPGLGIGIGGSIFSVVQQLLVLGLGVLVVGDRGISVLVAGEGGNLSQGEDEVLRSQKAAPR
jgi:hypothetical protein